MSAHCFHEIYIHLNWHCDRDMKLIHPVWESDLHKFLQSYCKDTGGVFYQGSNGTEDHVHLVIQMEPTVQLADFIGKIKGASSFEMNKRLGRKALLWQRGYGAVSFARQDLPGVLKYVANQKEHHAAGTTRETLEIGAVYFETIPALAEAFWKHAKARLDFFFAHSIHHLKVVANKARSCLGFASSNCANPMRKHAKAHYLTSISSIVSLCATHTLIRHAKPQLVEAWSQSSGVCSDGR